MVVSYSPKHNKPCECAYERTQLQHARGACCLQGLRDQHQCVLAAVCVCVSADRPADPGAAVGGAGACYRQGLQTLDQPGTPAFYHR